MNLFFMNFFFLGSPSKTEGQIKKQLLPIYLWATLSSDEVSEISRKRVIFEALAFFWRSMC